MEALGVSRDEHSPKLWRLLWRLGIPLAPPIRATFVSNFAVCASIFAVGFAILFVVRETETAKALLPYPGIAGVVLAIAGLVFGLAMASYWRSRRIKYGLPLWHAPELSSPPSDQSCS